MPTSVNGCGTMLVPARGLLVLNGPSSWSTSADDFDGLECLCLFLMPIIPYKAIHAFAMTGNGIHSQYRSIPIRWSATLVLRAFLRRWLAVPFFAAVMCGLIGSIGPEPLHTRMILFGVAASLALVGMAGWWMLNRADRRARDVRLVLGPHDFGASDPATWTDDLLSKVRDAREVFGQPSFGESVAPLLGSRRWANAMFAARIATAREDRVRGEELTDEVLGQADVRTALLLLRRDARSWQKVMDPSWDSAAAHDG